jgi:hypothetical protein
MEETHPCILIKNSKAKTLANKGEEDSKTYTSNYVLSYKLPSLQTILEEGSNFFLSSQNFDFPYKYT